MNFRIKLIPTHLDLVVVYSSYRSANKFFKNFDIEISEDWLGCCISKNETTTIFMYLSKPLNIPTIAHETLHVTWEIASKTGIVFGVDNDETQAYYMSYIMGEILKKIKF